MNWYRLIAIIKREKENTVKNRKSFTNLEINGENKKININISNNHIINIFSENYFHNHNIKNKASDNLALKKSHKSCLLQYTKKCIN